MTDFFAILDEPRRPWIDANALKAKFLALSATTHPDHAADAHSRAGAEHRFAELNAAHNCLRDAKERLHHLLVLETRREARQVRQIPPALADVIIPAEQACREANGFLAAKSRTTSPLMQAQFFEQAIGWTERLSALQRALNDFRARLDSEARSLNAVWAALDGEPPSRRAEQLPLAELEELYCAYSYLSRFQQQLQERIVQLAI